MSSITIKDGSIISISQVVNEYLDKTLDLVENVKIIDEYLELDIIDKKTDDEIYNSISK